MLQIWKARKAAVSEEIAIAERSAQAILDKLDRLNEVLFERTVDIDTYDRHAEKLREALSPHPTRRPTAAGRVQY